MVTYKKRLKSSVLFQWNLQTVCTVYVNCMAVLWKLWKFVVYSVVALCLTKIFYPLLLNVLELLLEIIHFMLHVVLVYNCLQLMNIEHIANALQAVLLLNICVMITIVI